MNQIFNMSLSEKHISRWTTLSHMYRYDVHVASYATVLIKRFFFYVSILTVTYLSVTILPFGVGIISVAPGVGIAIRISTEILGSLYRSVLLEEIVIGEIVLMRSLFMPWLTSPATIRDIDTSRVSQGVRSVRTGDS